MGMFIPTIVKMLSPKILKLIMDYVFKENELDKKVKELDEEVKMLIAVSHPKRDFVRCEECKHKIKEKSNE